MNDISFVDTTLRDGQQSLWALGMKTGAMLGAADQIDQAGPNDLRVWLQWTAFIGSHSHGFTNR